MMSSAQEEFPGRVKLERLFADEAAARKLLQDLPQLGFHALPASRLHLALYPGRNPGGFYHGRAYFIDEAAKRLPPAQFKKLLAASVEAAAGFGLGPRLRTLPAIVFSKAGGSGVPAQSTLPRGYVLSTNVINKAGRGLVCHERITMEEARRIKREWFAWSGFKTFANPAARRADRKLFYKARVSDLLLLKTLAALEKIAAREAAGRKQL
ncbi:MAG: hypothetical protein AB1626_02990 [Candidatus Micrarchaeota archaeon]